MVVSLQALARHLVKVLMLDWEETLAVSQFYFKLDEMTAKLKWSKWNWFLNRQAENENFNIIEFVQNIFFSAANARGGLFAGATAGNGVGAGASLAGDVNNGGSFGVGQAEAYVPGARKEVIKTVSTNVATNVDTSDESQVDTDVDVDVEAPVVVETSESETKSQIPESTTSVAPTEKSVPTTQYTIIQTTPSTSSAPPATTTVNNPSRCTITLLLLLSPFAQLFHRLKCVS